VTYDKTVKREAAMALPPQKTATAFPIEIPPDLQPAYANLARIAHAPAEFVMDFARLLPGDSKAIVAARVIMSPIALKLFAQAVNENLARYEATFGTINIPSGGSSLADTLFKPLHPPEPPQDPPKEPNP
jgi:hypothetical protein